MRVQILYSKIFLKILLFLTILQIGWAVICYDCYDTGPSNQNCTNAKNCTGSACLLYEGGDNKTTTAFCLLGPEYKDTTKLSTGCWLESDGLGKHCLCLTDFCNKLRDRTTVTTYDPFASPLPDLAFLKHNPFIDYEYIEDEKNVGANSKPAPSNVLFPGAAEIDLSVSGDSADNGDEKEDDLVPVDFEEYKDWEEKERQRNTVKSVSDRAKAKDTQLNIFPAPPEEPEGIALIVERPEVKITDEGDKKVETEPFNQSNILIPSILTLIFMLILTR